jgi:hypothetical protein
MKTNCSTIPKLSDFGIPQNGRMSGQQMIAYWNALRDWHTAFEMELTEKLLSAKAGHEEIKNKDDLIHNTMKIIASTEIGLIEEILGVQFKNKEGKE